MGVPVLSVPGVEADDVIGSLAARATAAGLDVVVVSPDKDFKQLLSPRLRLMRLVRSAAGAKRFYTLDDFVQVRSSVRFWRGLSLTRAWLCGRVSTPHKPKNHHHHHPPTRPQTKTHRQPLTTNSNRSTACPPPSCGPTCWR